MKSNHKHIKIIEGKIPVLLSAPHVVPILRQNSRGTHYIKPREKRVMKMLRLLCEKTGAWGIRTKGPGILVGWDEEVHDIYRAHVKDIIERNNIRLFLDLHGAKKKRPFVIDYDFKLRGVHPHDKKVENMITANFDRHIGSGKLSNEFFQSINGPGEETLTYFVRENHTIPAVQFELNEAARTNPNEMKNLIKLIENTVIEYQNLNEKPYTHHES